jgi:hypothetical protein
MRPNHHALRYKNEIKQIHPIYQTLPTTPVTFELVLPRLLGRYARQLRKSCAVANMVFLHEENEC